MQFQQLWHKQSQKLWIVSLICIGIVCWLAFLMGLGNIGLIDKTEALYVEVARQMVLTGNWISPHWNGDYFYSYPAGGYWFLALSFKIFGISEWAARFPVALSAIASVFVVFYTLRYFGFIGEKPEINSPQLWLTAWIGAGIMALNPYWIAWGRVAVSDMLLSSFVGLSMLSFFLGYAQPEKPKQQTVYYCLSPILAAIAVLIKGPIGIILPVLGIGAFLIYVGKFWEIFWEMKPFRALALFLLVALPWYIMATIFDGEIFINEFILESNFQRFTEVVFNHPGPWYYYIIWATVLMLPWSIYFPIALIELSCWRIQTVRQSARNSHLGIYAFAWFITTFVFFSSADTKLQGYTLPITPAVVIILALFWGEKLRENNNHKNKNNWLFITSSIVNIFILIALAIASGISGKLIGEDPTAPTLAENLVTSGIPIMAAISWGTGAILGIYLLSKKRLRKWLWSANFIAFLSFITLTFPPLIPLLDRERQLDFREISKQISQVIKPEEEVFLLGFTRYSTVYYSNQHINFIYDTSELKEFLKTHTIPSDTIIILGESNYLNNSKINDISYDILSEKQAYKLIRIDKKLIMSNEH